jgi:hypothetical protein
MLITQIFALLCEIYVCVRMDRRYPGLPPQGQYTAARLEEINLFYSRLMSALAHAATYSR